MKPRTATITGAGRLAGKRIVVTGAAGFVGRSIVEHCRSEGAKVFGFDTKLFRGHGKGRRSVNKGAFEFRVGDIASSADCCGLISDAVELFGGVDVLINAAGIMHLADGGPLDTTDAAWDETMLVNAKGPWLCCKACIPHLVKQRSGSIINIASIVALRGSYVSQIAYTTSKGALISLTRELAVYLAASNVRANAICPGPLAGGVMTSRLASRSASKTRLSQIPLGRLGIARDVALACVYLASDESLYVTGAELIVDGGAAAAFIGPKSSDRKSGLARAKQGR